jgi:hypothetical protein
MCKPTVTTNPMKQTQVCKTFAIGTLSAVLFTISGVSQSADALIKKLLEKGVLTEKEAQDLSNEAGQTNLVNASKWKLSDSIKNISLYGDFRGRFEQNNAENSQYFDRNRYRYRVRLGTVVSLPANFDVNLRLASGNPQVNPGGTLVGGQPITANTDLNSLESRKFVWVDVAYARWTPIKNSDWTVSGLIGKMDNPFLLSNMIWDYDINPEGGAFQIAYNLTDKQALKANGAFFVLDELNQGYVSPNTLLTGTNAPPAAAPSHDPYMYGAQALWESKWTPKFETSLGVAAFDIVYKESLSARVQPFYNSGNSRDANGFLKYNMNPIIGTASATYKLDSFPFYAGQFPIKVMGEYLDNPGAPANNKAYRAGVTFGKAGRKRAWEISYRYQRLEADAWFDALVDDDNGAFYATGNPQLGGTGKANGWFGGTNVKGHWVQATYSFTDSFNFTFAYYLNDLIIGAPGQSSSAGHFMADLMWRF